MEGRRWVKITSAETVLGLETQGFKGFKNTACEFWPCHPEEQMDGMGCMSCYCPLYFLQCPGTYTRLPNGNKDCSQCTIIHAKGGWEIVQQYMSEPRYDTGRDTRAPKDQTTTNKPVDSSPCVLVETKEGTV